MSFSETTKKASLKYQTSKNKKNQVKQRLKEFERNSERRLKKQWKLHIKERAEN